MDEIIYNRANEGILNKHTCMSPKGKFGLIRVDSELIAWASEQSPFFNVAKPKICCKLAAGPTSVDYAFKTPVDEEPQVRGIKKQRPT